MADSMEVCVLFFLLTHTLYVYGQLDVTVVPQEDYNAALNPDSKVTFNCTAFVANIEFRLNDTLAGNFIVSRGVAVTGVEPVGDELFVITVSISAREENDNTSVLCRAIDTSNIQNIVVDDSRLIFLRIQGLLDAPSNLTLSETDEQLTRLLTWNPPKTLDITNVDPDIEYYQVCYNLSTELTCTNVSSFGEREIKFSNVRVPLLFTVTAFNVVGEGNESSIVHQASNCDNVGVPSNINDVQSQISLTKSGPVAAIFFNQLRESPGMCFCVYEVRTNTTEHGPLLPVVEYFSSNNYVQLSLSIDSGLVENELYSASITTSNTDGMEITVGTVEFSTYDVQSGNIIALPGGLELSCTFVNGSQAQSCLLTVCRVEDGSSCIPTTTITRNGGSLTFTKLVTNLPPGMYTIGQVAEMEKDGEVTVVRGIDVGEVVNVSDVLTISATPSSPSDTPPTGGVSSGNTNAGAIAGGCAGVVLVMMFMIATVVVIVCKWYVKKQTRQETVVYDEPGSIVNTIPQTGLEMEQCPAYGVFNKR